MKVVRQKVRGQIAEQDGFRALVLESDTESEGPSLWLLYALVTMGKEEHIFPGLVLDDWGNEYKSLALYGWIRENGDRFPRAEVFGKDSNGEEAQLFVRVLELYATYPVYVDYEGSEELERVHAFILPDRTYTQPERITVPDHVDLPMREARVSWWRANPDQLGSLDSLMRVRRSEGER